MSEAKVVRILDGTAFDELENYNFQDQLEQDLEKCLRDITLTQQPVDYEEPKGAA